jgi:hypothetical protein
VPYFCKGRNTSGTNASTGRRNRKGGVGMAELMAIEMAELIERGLEFARDETPEGLRVQERSNVFLERVDAVYRAGALGLALVGRTADPGVALSQWMEVSNSSPSGRFEAAGRLLGISVALARLIEANHGNGLRATDVARELRIGTLSLSFCGRTAPALALRTRARPPERKLSVGLPTRESTSDTRVSLVAASSIK